MVDDIRNFSLGLDGYQDKLAQTIQRMERAGKEFQAAVKKQNQSRGQTESPKSQANSGLRYPPGSTEGPQGKFVTKDSGHYGVPLEEYRRLKGQAEDIRRLLAQGLARAGAGGSTGTGTSVVELKNIPSATIDEASFQRVVNAVEKNVSATKRVEKAIDRLANRIGKGGGKDGGKGGGPDVPPDGGGPKPSSRLTRAQNSELSKAFDDLLRTAPNKEQRNAIWKDLVKRQQAALAKGENLITPVLRTKMEEREAKAKAGDTVSPGGLEKLRAKAQEAGARVDQLRSALEAAAGVAGREAEAGRIMQELAAAEKKRVSTAKALEREETRSMTAERQRQESLREQRRIYKADPVTAEQRRYGQEVRARLELGGDRPALEAAKLKKSELADLADLFTQQGYRTDYKRNPDGSARSTRAELMDAIEKSGTAYRAGGRHVAEDLYEGRRVEKKSEISDSAAKAIPKELRQFGQNFTKVMAGFSISAERAFELLGINARSGGQDPLSRIDASSVPGANSKRNGRTKGRLIVGGEITGAAAEDFYGPEGPGTIGGTQVDRVIEHYQREQSEVARRAVGKKLSKDLGYNPHGDDLYSGVKGNGDAALAKRREIAALLRGVDEIDKFARDLHKLRNELYDTEETWIRATSRMTDYELDSSRPKTAEEKRAYNIDRQTAERAAAQKAEQQAALESRLAQFEQYTGGTMKGETLLTPEFRAGIQARDISRLLAANPDAPIGDRDLHTERDPLGLTQRPTGLGGVMTNEELNYQLEERSRQFRAPHLEAAQKRQALIEATYDTLGKSRIFSTPEGNTRDFRAWTLPGIKVAGKDASGRPKFGYRDEEQFEGKAERAFAARQLRGMTRNTNKYLNSMAELALALDAGDRSEEELDKIRRKLAKAMSRMLGHYQAAFPEAQALPLEQLLPSKLGGHDAGFDAGFMDMLTRSIDSIVTDENGYRRVQDKDALAEVRRMNKSDANRDKFGTADSAGSIEEKAAAAYNDPKRGDRLEKTTIKSLTQRNKQLGREIDTASEEIKEYRQVVSQAKRDLKKALGSKSAGRVLDLESELKRLQGRAEVLGAKISVSNRPKDHDELVANRAAQEAIRAKLDREYQATPATREAYTQRQAALEAQAAAEDRRTLLEENRARVQKTKRFLTGNVTKADIAEASGKVDDIQTRRDVTEKNLAAKTARLAQVRDQLARYRGEGEAHLADSEEHLDEVSQIAADQLLTFTNRLKAAEATARAAEHEGDHQGADAAHQEAADLRSQIGQLEAYQRSLGGIEAQAARETKPESGTTTTRNAFGPAVQQHEDRLAGKAEYNAAEREAEELEREIRKINGDLGTLDHELNQLRAALEAIRNTREAKDAGRGSKKEKSGGRGGSGGSGDDDGTAGAGGPGGPHRGDNILERILAAINKVNSTLKSGLKVTGKIAATQAGAAVTEGAGTTTKKAKGESAAEPIRASKQALADYQATLSQTHPKVAQLLKDEKDVAAATQLVTRGLMGQREAVKLISDLRGKDAKATGRFSRELQESLRAAEVQKNISRASSARAKEEAALLDDAYAMNEKFNSAEERSARKKEARDAALGRQQRATASAVMRMREVMGRLTPETQKEVTALERLVKQLKEVDAQSEEAAALQGQLAEQMARVHAGVQKDLGPASAGGGSEVHRQAAGALYEGAGLKNVTADEIDEAGRLARAKGFRDIDKGAAAGVVPGGIFGQQSLFTQAMFGNHGFWSRIMASTGTFVVRNFAAGFVFGLTAALQDVIAQAVETERTFVRVSHALEATGRSSDGLRGKLGSIAQEYGTQLNDVYEVAAGLTGLFDNPDDIAAATKIVAQLEMISSGALNAKEAMGALASIQGAFGDSLGSGVSGLEHVADVLTSVQNNLGTNVETTAEAVGRMSGLANELGLSYEEVAVYGAQIAKLTNQTGEGAGEQFSRILSVIQSGRGRSVLSGLEEFTDRNGQKVRTNIQEQLGARDYSGVLRTLQENWGRLTKVQQQNISVTIAGQRQAASFAALMANGQKTLNAIARAENSHGDAVKRTEALMKTLQGRVAKLGSEFQVLASNLIQTGILDFLGVFLGALNLTLHSVNAVFTELNALANSNPIVKFVSHAAVALIGFMAVLKLVRNSWRGLKATLDATPIIRDARQNYSESGGGSRTDSVLGQVRSNVQARGQQAVDAVSRTGQAPLYQRIANGPVTLATLAGRGLDVVVGRPLEAAGRAATRFSNTLLAASERMRLEIMAGRGSAFDARDVARAQRLERVGAGVGRFGQVTTGIGLGTREFFQGQGLGRLQRNFEARAARLNLDAVGARMSSDADPLNKALSRQALRMEMMASAADRASRGVTGVQAGLTRLGASGIGANAAMLGLGLAIAGITSVMQESAAAGDFVQGWVDDRKADKKKQGAEVTPYEGPAQDFYSEMTKKYSEGSGFGANFGRVWSYGWNTLKDAPGYFASFGQQDSSAERMTGTRDGSIAGLADAQKAYDKAMADLEEYAKQPGVTAADIAERSKSLNATIMDTAESTVNAADDMSNQQKAGVLASFEQANGLFTKAAQDRVLLLQGMASAALLEPQQLDRLNELMGTLPDAQASRYVNSDLYQGVKALTGEAGVDSNNPEIRDALDKLQEGGLGAADAAVAQTTILQETAKQAQAQYLLALSRGGTEEDLSPYRQRFEAALAAVAKQTDQNVQIFLQQAQLAAEAASSQGDYGAANRALLEGVAKIETQKPQGIETGGIERAPRSGPGGQTFQLKAPHTVYTVAQQEQIDKYNAQQRPLLQQYAQNIAKERNRSLELQATQAQSEVSSAQNALQQARNVLRAMRQARQINEAAGPTAQEIHDQRVAVLNAQRAFAQAQVAQRQAARETALSEVAPGDQVRQAEVALANAQANLKDAKIFGEKSTQYQQAQQQLNQAHNQLVSAQAAATNASIQSSQAWVSKTGDTVKAAQIGVYLAQQQLKQALEASGGAETADVSTARSGLAQALATKTQASTSLKTSEIAILQARAQVAGNSVRDAQLTARAARVQMAAVAPHTEAWNQAKAQLIQANKTIDDAMTGIFVSKMDVAIAIAESHGETVKAANLGVQQALTALQRTKAKEGSSEYNQLYIDLVNRTKAAQDAQIAKAQAFIGVQQALAGASGDGVREAQLAIRSTRVALSKARPHTAEYAQLWAELIGNINALQDAEIQKIQARIGVGIAMADAEGDAIRSTALQIQSTQAALQAATPDTAEFFQLQAELISNSAAHQDAILEKAKAAVGVSIAAAQANGNAVKVAVLQAKQAKMALNAATPGTAEYLQAQADLIGANDSIQQAQLDLVNARIGVSIAMAQARGDQVRVAQLQAKQAVAALHAATPGTAEYLQAKANVISARAQTRDAMLQERLDTINFNLEMGKMTQSAAIAALREILRTRNLTREQRRQIQLQIKGMVDELSGSPWNFGDIKLPKPYLMKRYIEEQRKANSARADAAIADSLSASAAAATATSRGSYNDNRNVYIDIHGGDIDKIKKVVKEYVGTPTRTRTSAPRRGRR